MKKTARRILAAIMVLAMMLVCIPMASAANVNNGGSYYETGMGYDETARLKYGEISTIPFTKAPGAKHFELYSDNSEIINIPNCESAKAFAAGYGATFVYIYQYDKNYDFITVTREIVVVYDDEDENLTGRITDVYAGDITMKCDEVTCVGYSGETDGDVYWYTVIEGETCNAVSVYGDEIYSFDRGTDTIRVYAIDTNLNVVETTCTVTVRFTFFQWISNFFNSIFSWVMFR